MHTIVCVKQVLDTRVLIKVEDGRIVQKEPSSVKIANPKDIAAVEEAMHLKELFGGEVTAISVGDEEVRSVLYQCLARGVDRAIHVFCPSVHSLDAFSICSSIGKVVSGLHYDLILCGDRSHDEGRGYMVPFLANFLGCPQATKVVKIEFNPEQHVATVWRQLERGWREEVECRLPAVFGIERTAHEPRYVSVFSREAVLTKQVNRLEAEVPGKGEQFGASLQVVEVTPPRPRTKKTFVPDASLSPEERFQLLLSGGVAPKKSSDFIEGAPGQVARGIVDFLKKEGFIHPSGPNNSSCA